VKEKGVIDHRNFPGVGNTGNKAQMKGCVYYRQVSSYVPEEIYIYIMNIYEREARIRLTEGKVRNSCLIMLKEKEQLCSEKGLSELVFKIWNTGTPGWLIWLSV